MFSQFMWSLRLSPAALLSARVSSLAASTEARWTPLGSSGTFACGPQVSRYLPLISPTIITSPLHLTTSSSEEQPRNLHGRFVLWMLLCTPSLALLQDPGCEKGMRFVCLPAAETVAQGRWQVAVVSGCSCSSG